MEKSSINTKIDKAIPQLSTDHPLCEKDEQAKAAKKAQQANEKALTKWREMHKENNEKQN